MLAKHLASLIAEARWVSGPSESFGFNGAKTLAASPFSISRYLEMIKVGEFIAELKFPSKKFKLPFTTSEDLSLLKLRVLVYY